MKKARHACCIPETIKAAESTQCDVVVCITVNSIKQRVSKARKPAATRRFFFFCSIYLYSIREKESSI